MKVGDLVIHRAKQVGVITHLWVGGAAAVLFEDGEWDVDEDDLEVISERSELGLSQLDEVRGGMSSETYDRWRIEKINESR